MLRLGNILDGDSRPPVSRGKPVSAAQLHAQTQPSVLTLRLFGISMAGILTLVDCATFALAQQQPLAHGICAAAAGICLL